MEFRLQILVFFEEVRLVVVVLLFLLIVLALAVVFREEFVEVDFFVGNLITGLKGRQADLLMANILANVLREFARELVAAVAPGGWLVLSGILATEIEAVRRDFATVAPGWALETRTMGEWADLKLVRPQ